METHMYGTNRRCDRCGFDYTLKPGKSSSEEKDKSNMLQPPEGQKKGGGLKLGEMSDEEPDDKSAPSPKPLRKTYTVDLAEATKG